MRPSLVEIVTTQILDRIANNEFPPGSVLPAEEELARLMDASRPTCREAVKVLGTQQVLHSAQGRGTFVNPVHKWISLDAILRMHDRNLHHAMIQLIEVRSLIEIGAAEMFAPLCRAEHVEVLVAELASMRLAHTTKDVDKFVTADIAFHQQILDGCGNPFIAATFLPIARALHDGRVQTSSVADIRRNAILEHAAIIKALKTNSSGEAAAAMRSHLEQTRRDAMHYLAPLGRAVQL